MKGLSWFTETRTFLSEVKSEMKKCSYPTREEVVGTTAIVLITSVVFAVYLWIADIAIVKGYEGILRVFGS
jgi:preprotein translocase subunit SecE